MTESNDAHRPEADGHVGRYTAAFSSTKAKPRRSGVCESLFEVTLSCDGPTKSDRPAGAPQSGV